METSIRPLTLGEILDRTAQLYRTNFLLFAGIFACYAGVLMVLNLAQLGLTAWIKVSHIGLGLRIGLFGVTALRMLIIVAFAAASMAAINRAVAWVHLGQPASIASAYKSTLPRLGRYVWLSIIVDFMIFWPLLILAGIAGVVIIAVPGIMSGKVDASNPSTLAAAGLGFGLVAVLMLPWIGYAVWMGLRYSLAVPCCVLEDLKARAAIKRSIELSKGARERIFVLFLLVLVVQMGLTMLTQSFLFVLAFKHPGQIGVVPQAISQIIAFFTNTFLGPILATGVTVFYYDQRVRKEGFDIEWMMQAAGMTPPAPAELPAANPAPPAEDAGSLHA
jgi:hypothetical protein